VAEVAAIAKFRDVFPHVLRRNVDVSSAHSALKQRPVALRGVCVGIALHIFAGAVDNRFVAIASVS
jgi:hypothetical protein